MGQKVNPVGFRVGHFLPWKSRWFSDDKKYKDNLYEDILIRRSLMEKLKLAGINEVEIARLPKSMVINLEVSRPGVVIGRGGSGIEEIRREVVALLKRIRKQDVSDTRIELNVREVKNPELAAQLVAQRIVGELERRLPHRRVVMKTMERVIQSGALGIKVVLSGRIAGAEIARNEKYQKGSVPTQSMREDIDYAQVPALLKRGYVGVKVWIYRKEAE